MKISYTLMRPKELRFAWYFFLQRLGRKIASFLGTFVFCAANFLAFPSSATEVDWPSACTNAATDQSLPQRSYDPKVLFYFELGSHRFAIPWGYLSPRIGLPRVRCADARDALGLQFWIPGGEAPEQDLNWQPDRAPKEQNHAPRGPDESVVEVRSLKNYEHAPSATDDPEISIKNLLDTYGTHAQIDRQGDLNHLLSTEYPQQQGYWFKRTDKETMLFFCLRNDDAGICQGDLDLRDLHFSANLLVTYGAVRQTTLMISTLRELLKQWEISK